MSSLERDMKRSHTMMLADAAPERTVQVTALGPGDLVFYGTVRLCTTTKPPYMVDRDALCAFLTHETVALLQLLRWPEEERPAALRQWLEGLLPYMTRDTSHLFGFHRDIGYDGTVVKMASDQGLIWHTEEGFQVYVLIEDDLSAQC